MNAPQYTISVTERAPLPDAAFAVTVTNGTKTTHTVTLTRAYYDELTGEQIEPAELIRRAFAFLLAREQNTAILGTFDLSVIETYFPDFPDAIRDNT